jgi:outer membrane receptor protein involved in Fe transport
LNPLQNLESEYRKRTITAYNFNGYFNYQISKAFSFRSTFGYDVNKTESRSFDDTLTSTSRSFNKLPLVVLNNIDRYTINNSNVLTWSNPSLFKSKHAINILLGHEIYSTLSKSNSMELRYFPVGLTPDQAFANLGLASAPAGFTQPRPASTEGTTTQVSFFTSVKYDFNKRYFLTFNLRADGSSLFGPNYSSPIALADSTNRKWGYFPSLAFAWRFSQEKFMEALPFVSDAKLRLSIGQAGNNRIAAYGFTTGWIPPSNGGYGLSDALAYTLVTPNRLGNPIITWETLQSKNAGLDLEFLKGRFTLTVDAYSNTTKDLLIENKFPATSGYQTQYQNVGSVRNNGLELQLGGNVINKKDFQWNRMRIFPLIRIRFLTLEQIHSSLQTQVGSVRQTPMITFCRLDSQ